MLATSVFISGLIFEPVFQSHLPLLPPAFVRRYYVSHHFTQARKWMEGRLDLESSGKEEGNRVESKDGWGLGLQIGSHHGILLRDTGKTEG